VSAVHMVVGIAVLASNAAASAWGGYAWIQGLPSHWFWVVLRVAQATVAVEVALGLILVARGASSPDGLHMAYGLAMLAVTVIAEGTRLGAAQRLIEEEPDIDSLDRAGQMDLARRVSRAEMGVMTVGVLLVLTLALRAYQTGG
jgi:hypothetical protein